MRFLLVFLLGFSLVFMHSFMKQVFLEHVLYANQREVPEVQ